MSGSTGGYRQHQGGKSNIFNMLSRKDRSIIVGSCAVVMVTLFLLHSPVIRSPNGLIVQPPVSSPDQLSEDTESHKRSMPLIDKSPLAQLRHLGSVDLPSKGVLEKLNSSTLYKIYHSYLDNINYLCHRRLRMGKVGDGGWEVCDDEDFRPITPCLVYSFGINHDFSFDDDIAKNYRCQVLSFDPSMKVKSHKRSPRVHFYKLGIAGSDKVVMKKGWELRSLSSFKRQFKHTERIIDVLKMDVEGAEWSALPQMVSSGQLSRVRQLFVEFHGAFKARAASVPALKLLEDLHAIGFRKFYVHKNRVCRVKSPDFPVLRTACYEVHYVNINLLE
ncbi:probable methyltransferase-like protein 24 isoform X1 [Haliotis rufescens]|uniref:probable methyltransferase-like protein 24 isoform X1 n=3 Tax=Haliotis rufescens TaxID=6454 RepID=UPI001EB006D7|nr:probable methyltransferase-like protein 24 isoform X1 [Haliotis rufescens]